MKGLGAPLGLAGYPVPAELDDPRFRWMYDYWHGRMRGDALPGRGDVDPVDFPRLLGQVNLIDVVRGGPRMRFRYRYRLWGSLVTEIIGADLTGRFLDEIDDAPDSRETHQVLQQAVRTRGPHFWQRPVQRAHQRFASYRRLLLPLAEDGATVDMLLALLIGDLTSRQAGPIAGDDETPAADNDDAPDAPAETGEPPEGEERG